MIQKLRRRFIVISVTVLSVTMLALTLAINIANWTAVRSEISATITELATARPMASEKGHGGRNGRGKHGESIYESRYFTVTEGPEGMHADISNVSSYTEEETLEMAERAIAEGQDSGFVDECCYHRISRNGSVTLLFLDCGSRLASVRDLLLISLASCGAGILIAWLLMERISGRAIRPFVENSEKQKRFITDASHELKTPLSVIGANMEVLAMDDPENEWILSTRRQVGAMTRMVNDMVFLTRSDEGLRSADRTEIELADLVRELTEPFSMMAEADGRTLQVDAPDTLRITGDRRGIERLISILCDNALKYSAAEDRICLTLSAAGAYAVIETDNAPAAPISADQLKHLFDRFYRADDSRTRKDGRGGYGIGLAIARAVCEAHGGDATALLNGDRIRIRCRLRIK